MKDHTASVIEGISNFSYPARVKSGRRLQDPPESEARGDVGLLRPGRNFPREI